MQNRFRAPLKCQPSLGFRIGDFLGLLILFLVPTPGVLGDWTIRGADGVRLLTIFVRLVMGSGRRFAGGHFLRVSGILLTMFLCACCSLLLGISQTSRDMLDVFRLAMFWMFFAYGASLAAQSHLQHSVIVSCFRLLLAIGILNASFSVLQILFPASTQFLQLLYSPSESRHIATISSQSRAIGFFINPNTNSVMLNLFSLAAIPLLQLTGRRTYLYLGLFVLACSLLTGSRTGFFLSASIIMVVCIGSRKFSYLVAMSFVALASYLVLDFLVASGEVKLWLPYMAELLIKIHASMNGSEFDVESFNSFRARTYFWEETLVYFYRNPVFGAGPLRAELYSFTDNYYIYLLSRYGIMGLACYLGYTLYIAVLCVRLLFGQAKLLRSVALMVIASITVVNIANYTLDAFPIVPIGSICLIYSGYLIGLTDLQNAMGKSRRALAHQVEFKGLRSTMPRPADPQGLSSGCRIISR